VTRALTVAAVVLAGVAAAPTGSAGLPRPAIRGAGSASAIPGSYIVKLKDTPLMGARGVASRARTLSGGYHGQLGYVWERALHGFSVTMREGDAQRLAADPDVDYVEQDQLRMAAARPKVQQSIPPAGTRALPGVAPHLDIHGQSDAVASAEAAPGGTPAAAQTPVSWGLDRIDQHTLPLDNHYSYDDSAGQGVHVYIVSSGINISHPDFGGRAAYGPNFVNDGQPNSDDCAGRAGTEEAGVIGGAQYGVAKKASLIAVRIFGCDGLGPATGILDGFNWVISNAIRPAVINFDLNDLCFDPDTGNEVLCDPATRQTLISAQETAFAAGIAVITDAGNHAIDTCGNSSGAAPDSLYIGATTSSDAKQSSSNFGPCLTMWAPGDSVTTDEGTGTAVDSGTQLASAYVAGAVALFMGKPEFAGATPGQIRTELVTNRSTSGVISGLILQPHLP